MTLRGCDKYCWEKDPKKDRWEHDRRKERWGTDPERECGDRDHRKEDREADHKKECCDIDRNHRTLVKNEVTVVCKPEREEDTTECRVRKCACETTELVKNGGFEVPGDDENTFKFWTIEIAKPEKELASIGATDDSYEGVVAAQFSTEPTNELKNKRGRIFQDVKVTPGCLYRLSFAENLEANGTGFTFGELTARVFHTDPAFNQFDLIRVFIRVDSTGPINTGFKFHQAVASIPVPAGVSTVTVEFSFVIRDRATQGQGDDEWMIDGVSLRSEFCNPIC